MKQKTRKNRWNFTKSNVWVFISNISIKICCFSFLQKLSKNWNLLKSVGKKLQNIHEKIAKFAFLSWFAWILIGPHSHRFLFSFRHIFFHQKIQSIFTISKLFMKCFSYCGNYFYLQMEFSMDIWFENVILNSKEV